MYKQISRHRRKIVLCIACALTIAIFLIAYESEFKQSISYQKFVEVKYKSDVKYILLWQGFFQWPLWQFTDYSNSMDYVDPSVLTKLCPHSKLNFSRNCVITTNPKFLNSVAEFDAVVFHGSECRQILEPTPKFRSVHQKYVMAKLEPKARSHRDFRLDDNFFNWTMMYRIGSDIIWAYGEFVDKETNEIISPSKSPLWREPEFVYDQHVLEIASNKPKMAAWFVSDCETASRREVLVNSLKKYIDIDVYGKCGTHRCDVTETQSCMDLVEKNYKFYLSFENELESGYITEKVFFYMNIYTIPVVYGGANYNQYAPPHSYINVNDYDTVEELANYLRHLSSNHEEYMKYFWWKKYYKIVENNRNGLCSLCDKLQNDENVNQPQVYPSMKRWIDFGSSEFIKF